MSEKIECKSIDGVTIGLIDSLITISHVLARRDLSSYEVREALADLQSDKDARALIGLCL